MQQVDLFWKLDRLSDGAVLCGVQELVGSGRRVLAALLAHLGEVEERRLHLAAGHGSMFAYCISRLSLSEDEAYRRIEVARLARRFPALFPLLADGRISLSVAALLKAHLSASNMDELTELVCGASVQRARELLAARFPRPDVPATIRKLPTPIVPQFEVPGASLPGMMEPTAPAKPSARVANGTLTPASGAKRASEELRHGLADREPPASVVPGAVTQAAPPDMPSCAASRASATHRALVPLAQGRYKVQFTADAELKHKLELARDLMRHALPGGDLAAIVDRALDLLVERLMRRRFGARGKRSPKPPPCKAEPRETAMPPPADAPPAAVDPSPDITRATRRVVLERDGLRCSFRSDAGVQCNARAWLEHDHIQPRARGGEGDATNIRILCRAHNRFAAELTYGRAHVENAIRRRRGVRTRAAREQTGPP
jgi:hypothetical protein